MKVITVTGSKISIGKFTLTEKELFTKQGEFLDTVCEVKRRGGKEVAVYCSINDALAHKCEWLEE